MAEEHGAKPADPKEKMVLIVDDDESVLNLLEILIQRDGFKVILASDGEKALLQLGRKPDALVLDLMLPGTTSGFGVLRHLRQSKGHIPPVIVVTAFADKPEVAEVKADPNVVLFLSKPINQDKLLEALHKVLKTKAPERKQSAKKAGGGKLP